MQGDNPTLGDAAALTLNLSASPIASSSHSHGDPRNEIICEGWLLKKRRKKLQGNSISAFDSAVDGNKP